MKKVVVALFLLVLLCSSVEGQTLCIDCPKPGSWTCDLWPAVCEACWANCVNELPRPVPRRPRGRVEPDHLPILPREVGVNVQFIGTQCAGAPWWWITCQYPTAMSGVAALEYVALQYNIRVFAMLYGHHLWEYEWENPRKLFRSPLADVIMLSPSYWGYTTEGCNGDEIVSLGLTGTEYPTDDSLSHILCDQMPEFTSAQIEQKEDCYWRNQSLFAGLYEMYGNQKKTIIITSTESDWDMQGVGCRNLDGPCPKPDSYPGTCADWREDMRLYLLHKFNRRQAGVEAARAEYQDAELTVLHNIEVVFFGNQPWQTKTVACDVIPFMDHLPDTISVSLYNMSDGPEYAIEYVHQCTGIPYNRIIVSEVGIKNHDRQYERIYSWIDRAFQMGVRLALVWDVELGEDVFDTGYSVVDRSTGEWFPGMQAIHDLNEKWRGR